MPTAYSYVRWSSPVQAQGYSRQRQDSARDEWLVKNPAAVLDTKLSMRDEGLSAYTGANRKDTACLGQFLEMVKRGDIPKGSFLLVEALDRLSRAETHDGLELLLRITSAGVTVVQLLPAVVEFRYPVQPMPLMIAIVELSRANSESEVKSQRLGKQWATKRKQAAEGKRVRCRLPGWLKWQGEEITTDDKRAETLNLMFALAARGYGSAAVAEELNRVRAKTWGNRPYWSGSTVNSILRSKAAIGVWEPKTEHRTDKRVKAGDPIAGYFPAVVDEKSYWLVQSKLTERRTSGKTGRPAKRGTTLFGGLVRDAVSGSNFVLNAGTRSNLLVPYFKATAKQPGPCSESFPVEVFELGILSKLAGLDHGALIPNHDREELAALSSELAEVSGRLLEIQREIEGGRGSVRTLSMAAERLEGRKAFLLGEVDRVKAAAAHPAAEVVGEMKGYIEALSKQPIEEIRVRLRAAIRRVVERIHCVVRGSGITRTLLAQIRFRDALPDQLVNITYTRAGQGPGWKRPASWEAVDWRGGSCLSLQDADTARRLYEAE